MYGFMNLVKFYKVHRYNDGHRVFLLRYTAESDKDLNSDTIKISICLSTSMSFDAGTIYGDLNLIFLKQKIMNNLIKVLYSH